MLLFSYTAFLYFSQDFFAVDVVAVELVYMFVSSNRHTSYIIARLTERNCTDESPNGLQFFVVFVPSRVLSCCRRASWPADCRSVETMLVIDF